MNDEKQIPRKLGMTSARVLTLLQSARKLTTPRLRQVHSGA